MASSYFSADLGAIRSVGSSLQGVSASVQSGAQFGSGSGFDSYSDLVGAIDDFRGKWDNAVNHLTNAIGTLGRVTGQVGTLMAEHDAGMAQAWGSQE